MMNKRDKAILNDLERFRVMSRQDICDLHFTNVKHPVSSCNNVLKRLRRDGYIEANTSYHPYLYFPVNGIKKDSAKINHFLAILDFYKRIRSGKLRQFIVEPKYGKGFMEPDIFVIVNGAPFFVEIQRNEFSDKVMDAKMKRYEKYFYSGEWREESWQPDKPFFPHIWFITEKQYNFNSKLRVIQTKTAEELFQKNASA